MSVSPRKRLRDLLLQKQARNNASSATANNAPITTATTANNTPSTTAVIFYANDLGADGLPVRSVLAEPPRLNVMEDTYINLRNILPSGFSYLLYYHKETKTDEFLGAPGQSFMACIRVNFMTEEAAKEFIVKFNATSLSTFRVSRGAGESKGQKVIMEMKMLEKIRQPGRSTTFLKAAEKHIRKASTAWEKEDITAVTDMTNGVGRETTGVRIGRRIPVQVTATSRRADGRTRGRKALRAGRRPLDVGTMPARNKRKEGKRPHDLAKAVSENRRH